MRVADIIADPPTVHPEAPGGVWSTDADCYEFIAAHINAGSRTIETGCGISTAVFAMQGAHHTCVTPFAAEADATREWCERHEISTDNLTFLIGSSVDVLPTLDQTAYDLVLIDGEHQHPTPTVDWYYTARALTRGAIVIVDDVQLPAPRLVADYMEGLSPFRTLRRTAKWAALELATEPPPATEWKLPVAGTVLVPGGRFERLGRKLDRVLRRD
jgi:predicted O-methyltransferase YrrM